MVKINGVEFDIDLMDADVMERLETAAEDIQKKIAVEKSKTQKSSNFIRTFNKLTEDFIDTVLGEGASAEIFNGSQNMMEHMTAYEGIFTAKDAAMSEIGAFSDNFQSKYSPNRAARRAAAKGNRS